MASRRSTRSRKRRRSPGAPRAVASSRRTVRTERRARVGDQHRRSERVLGREGERPEGLFGGLPVSELAIFAGLIGAVVGWVESSTPALVAGLVACGLGVVEVTAREHFSGYRSHTALLAAFPALAVEVALVLAFGEPRRRPLLLVAVVPVFAMTFWLLRRRFLAARQARVARSAAPRV